MKYKSIKFFLFKGGWRTCYHLWKIVRKHKLKITIRHGRPVISSELAEKLDWPFPETDKDL